MRFSNKNDLLDEMVKLHRRYSHQRKSSPSSDVCSMWSVSDPPDVIEGTAPLEDIEDLINYGLGEDDAFNLYDMNIADAVDWLWVNIIEAYRDPE